MKTSTDALVKLWNEVMNSPPKNLNPFVVVTPERDYFVEACDRKPRKKR